MIEQDTIKLLRECDAGVKMGVDSIDEVLPYVKDDELKVGQYIAATAKELGGEIKVVDFYRFEKGEGIQKREDNFAEEIAKLTGK